MNNFEYCINTIPTPQKISEKNFPGNIKEDETGTLNTAETYFKIHQQAFVQCESNLDDFLNAVTTQHYSFTPALFKPNPFQNGILKNLTDFYTRIVVDKKGVKKWKAFPHRFKTNEFLSIWRNKSNFVSSQMIAIDIDDNYKSIIEIQDKIKSLNLDCNYIYTSLSHSDIKPKVRIGWILEDVITDKAKYEQYINILTHLLNADPACVDCSRFYFNGKEVVYKNNDYKLDLNSLIDIAKEHNKTIRKTTKTTKKCTSKSKDDTTTKTKININNKLSKQDERKINDIINSNNISVCQKALDIAIIKKGELQLGKRHNILLTYFHFIFNNTYVTKDEAIDFLKKYDIIDIDDAINICDDASIVFERTKSMFSNNYKNNDTNTLRLPDLIKGKYINSLDIDFSKNLILCADTGTGKTTTLFNELEKCFILFPNRDLLQQEKIKHSTSSNIVNAIKAGIKPNNDNKQLGTYNSITKILKDFSNEQLKQITLVIDESHNFATSANIRTDIYHILLNNFDKFKNVILLSATYINVIGIDFQKLIIKRKQNKIKAKLILKYKSHFDFVKRNLTKNTDYVYLNNKKEQNKWKVHFEKNGLSVLLLNADEQKNNAHYLKSGIIPSYFDLVLFTNTFVEGININNLIVGNLIICEKSIHFTRQAVGRFRNTLPKTLFIFLTKDTNLSIKSVKDILTLNDITDFYNIEKNIQKNIYNGIKILQRTIDVESLDDDDKIEANIILKVIEQNTYNLDSSNKDLLTNDFSIDVFKIAQRALDTITQQLFKSEIALTHILNLFDIEVTDVITTIPKGYNKISKEQTQLINDKYVKKEQLIIDVIKEELKNNEYQHFYNVADKNNEVETKIHNVLMSYNEFLNPIDCLNLLTQNKNNKILKSCLNTEVINTNKKRLYLMYDRVCKQYKKRNYYAILKENVDYTINNEIYTKINQSFKESFKKEFAFTEITNIFESHNYTQNVRKKDIVKFLSLYVTVENNIKNKSLKIISVNPLSELNIELKEELKYDKTINIKTRFKNMFNKNILLT